MSKTIFRSYRTTLAEIYQQSLISASVTCIYISRHPFGWRRHARISPW